MKKIQWPPIAVYYLIAVAVSAPFRLGVLHPERWLPLPAGLNMFYSVLRGIGPAVGFIVMVYAMRSDIQRTLSFWGVNASFSLLAALVIPVGLAVTGVSNRDGYDEHYYGLIYGLTLTAYALGEEYGWRGYLQEALAPMKMIPKILLIAVLWYAWHLNFLNPDMSVRSHVIHFLSLVLGAWGLLKVTETTRSILFAAGVHLSFNILTEVQGKANDRMIILSIAIVIWGVLMRIIIRRGKSERSAAIVS